MSDDDSFSSRAEGERVVLGEWISRIRSQLKLERIETSKFLEEIYVKLLRRHPDASVTKIGDDKRDWDSFVTDLVRSPEFRKTWRSPYPTEQERGPDVLLFGAYGNGNLGDVLQAASLERLIRRQRPDIRVWATSELPARYEYNYARILPCGTVTNPIDLANFKHLIIGGGGLLAHPHDPLFDPQWQESLSIPVSLVGVGVSKAIAERSSVLIKKASHVYARDHVSMDACKTFRSEVGFACDPIFADDHWDFDPPQRVKRRSRSILWILKFCDLASYSKVLSNIDPRLDTICVLEPFLDFPLLLRWPDAQLIYDGEALVRLIDRHDLVVTMRYHGAIFAMARGVPCYGFREDKIRDHLARFDLQSQFDVDGSAFDRKEDYAAADRRAIRRERKEFSLKLSEVLEDIDE